ncbi:MAG TPA: hypothetical protein DCW68_07280 [Rhodospirillaceae bacterium]|nr:MAG: hypothetical protein A2018_06785 [Alphaproteobacteria bacterium GWF2_58_20]HAU29888.1 hypothetical protein [Rhodospirillaceae bacterium]
METASGTRLPCSLAASGFYRGPRNMSVFVLLDFPLNGWHGFPVPGGLEEQALYNAMDLVQHVVESRHARLLDADGNPVDLRLPAELAQYPHTQPADWVDMGCQMRRRFWGGFDRAFKRFLKRKPQPGQCHVVDGWHVWDDAP